MKSLFIALLASIQAFELKMVIEFFRHGARSPTGYINPVDKEDTLKHRWYIPPGYLTPVGARQHYLLGGQMRQEYCLKRKFISDTHSEQEIAVISSNYERTQLSAHYHLAGMFPNSSFKEGAEKGATIPLNPVKYASAWKYLEKDNVFVFPVKTSFFSEREMNIHDHCKAFKQDLTQNPLYIKERQAILDNLYPEFKEETNLHNKHQLLDEEVLARLVDDTMQSEANNLKMPPKFKEKLLEPIKQFRKVFFEKLWFDSPTQYLARVGVSRLLEHTLTVLDRRILRDIQGEGYSKEDPKMVIFSVHDSTLVMLQKVMKLDFAFNFTEPLVASSLVFELEKHGNSFYIKFVANEKVLFRIDFSVFLSRIKQRLVSQSEIDWFCKFNVEPKTSKFESICMISLFGLVGWFVLEYLDKVLQIKELESLSAKEIEVI